MYEPSKYGLIVFVVVFLGNYICIHYKYKREAVFLKDKTIDELKVLLEDVNSKYYRDKFIFLMIINEIISKENSNAIVFLLKYINHENKKNRKLIRKKLYLLTGEKITNKKQEEVVKKIIEKKGKGDGSI